MLAGPSGPAEYVIADFYQINFRVLLVRRYLIFKVLAAPFETAVCERRFQSA